MKGEKSGSDRRPSKDEFDRMREVHERMMNDPANREHFDRARAQMQLGQPAYAMLDAALPGEAAVRVIRDPAAAMPRLIILSLPRVDEITFALAQGVLFKSEFDEPEITDAITIDILPDRRTLTTRHGADPVLRSIGGHSTASAHRWREMEGLKKRALRRAPVALGELGNARIIPAQPQLEMSKWMQAIGYVTMLLWIVLSPLFAFRFSPLRAALQALDSRQKRKLEEEWRRKSTVAASFPARHSGEHRLWAFTPTWGEVRKSRSGKRRS